MNDLNTYTPYGYFKIVVRPLYQKRLLTTNNERAFIISKLQEFLAFKSSLEHVNPYNHPSRKIDLLAYSISGIEIHLLMFSLSRNDAVEIVEDLMETLKDYRYEYSPSQQVSRQLANKHLYSMSIVKIKDTKSALDCTVDIHSNHSGGEFDRYSSIGFYLHDRRGDWMRIWRITSLYDNDIDYYRQKLHIACDRVLTA